MSNTRRVVVQGGGKNLYKISESSGWHHVYKVDVGFLTDSSKSIGKTHSLEDALAIIRSHSGRDIQEIS
jgi:hypothetical protein